MVQKTMRLLKRKHMFGFDWMLFWHQPEVRRPSWLSRGRSACAHPAPRDDHSQTSSIYATLQTARFLSMPSALQTICSAQLPEKLEPKLKLKLQLEL